MAKGKNSRRSKRKPAKKTQKKKGSKSKSPKESPKVEAPMLGPDVARLQEIAKFAKQIEVAENETSEAEATFLKLKEATSAAKKAYESSVAILRSTIRKFRGESGPNLWNQQTTATVTDTKGGETIQYEAEAWRDVSIGDLDISDNAVTKLAGHAKIATLGDLSDYMKDSELTDIKGIGAKASDKIEDSLAKWFKSNPAKCPPLKSSTGDHDAEPPAPKQAPQGPQPGEPDYEGDGSKDPHAWRGIGIDNLRVRAKIGEHRITDGIATRLVGFELLTLGHIASAIADGSIKTIKKVGPKAVDKIVAAFNAFGDQFTEYRESMVAAARGDRSPVSGTGAPGAPGAPAGAPGGNDSGDQSTDPASPQQQGTAVIGVELSIERIDYGAQELVDALISRVSGSCSTPFEIDGKLYVTLDYNEDETRIELRQVKPEGEDTPTDAEILTDSLLEDNYEFLEDSKLIIIV